MTTSKKSILLFSIIIGMLAAGCGQFTYIEKAVYDQGKETYASMGSKMYYDDFYHARIYKSSGDTVGATTDFYRVYSYHGYTNGILKIKEQYYYPQKNIDPFLYGGNILIYEFQITPPETIAIRGHRFRILEANQMIVKFVPLGLDPHMIPD